MKKQNGFTLVEAIVVAVIMAVLAAVAVPMYLGYVEDSKQKVVDNIAQSAAAAANAYWRKTGSTPDSSKLNVYLTEPGKFKISVAGDSVKVANTETPPKTKTIAFK